MAMSGGKDDGSPMMEMNTTPLIDVMLVLLIMFIITIPVATHAVNIDLPTPSPNPPANLVKPDKNTVVITAEDEKAANVLNWIKKSGVTKFGFVGNEQYAAFAKDPKAPPAKAN